jgi:hypothetical protein
MSGAGGMDVRMPIGLMFLIIGVILIGYGAAMAVFGGLFVGLAVLGKKG